jgi:hypothetical protein
LDAILPDAIAIDDEPGVAVGAQVWLAGFGASYALSREPPALRMVAASVVAVDESCVKVGSVAATACRGDSGGPMLVDRGGGKFRVAGVIHGPQGVICGSPTEVTALREGSADLAWLRSHRNEVRNGWLVALLLGSVLVVVALLFVVRRLRPR